MKSYSPLSSLTEAAIDKINEQETPLDAASSLLITMKVMQEQYEHE